MLKKTEPYWPLILLLALIKFVLPIFLQSPVYELQRDEYLYFQQGQHIALGYLENPPLLSYLGMISSWFGGSVAWIKFWPCLLGAATVVITCLITAELGGRRFAQFLAGLGIITSGYLRVHFLFQPNILDIFSWTLAIYFLIRYINTKKTTFIYWLAASIALGWWGKYSIVFMATAIIIGLLLTRHRTIFLAKQTWLAVILAGLLILPNVWWQFQHNWPLIHHMKELRQTQLGFINPADFLKDQLVMLVPMSFVWIAGLIWLLHHKTFRIIAFIYLTVILLLVLGSGKSYYALGAYPMLLAAGAVTWQNITQNRTWARAVIIGLVLVLFIPLVPLLLPVWKPEKLAAFYKEKGIGKMGLLKWEDQKDHALPQDFADMLGWKELAAKTEKFFHTLSEAIQSNTIIFCDNYGQAGSLKYYGKDPYFKSRVMSTNGSFLLWIPERIGFSNMIFVADEMPGDDEELFRHFQTSTLIDSVTNSYSRQFGNKVFFFQNIDSIGRSLAIKNLKDAAQPFHR
jgi:Dolichyl-phosphate-mannose-protein mannosyltransferase